MFEHILKIWGFGAGAWKTIPGKSVQCSGLSLTLTMYPALLTICFMECGGADKWGAEMFGARTVPVEIIKEMRSKAIEIVPPYQMSKMLPQVIETPEQLLGKILHHKKD